MTEPRTALKDSHPSPRFLDIEVQLRSVYASKDRSKLLGTIIVSGRVTSDICDLVPGEQGTIQEIQVFVCWEYITTAPTRVTKLVDPTSLTKPYPMVATFHIELNDVKIGTGSVLVELRAIDLVPGVGLIGFAQYVSEIELAPEAPASSTSGSAVNEFHWSKPRPIGQSTGGEIHPYYLSVNEPTDELKRSSLQKPPLIAPGPDDRWYIAGPDGRPEANVLCVLGGRSGNAAVEKHTVGSFERGFLGAMERSATFVLGSQQLRNPTNGQRPYVLEARIGDFSRAVQAVFGFLDAVNSNAVEIHRRVAVQDWDRFTNESKSLAIMGMIALSVVDEITKDAEPFVRGETQARVCNEILGLVRADAPSGRVSKTAILTKLQEAQFLHNKRSVIGRVIDAFARLPF